MTADAHFAPGKVILLGEHGAVYGEPAIAAAISLGVTARTSPATRATFVPPATLKGAQGQALKTAVNRAFELTGRPAVRLELESTLPLSMGLGSSGALSVAVSRALLASTPSRSRLAKVDALALEMERTFHGTPSGLDHMTSNRGGIQYFVNRRPRALSPRRPFDIVVALVGERPSTKLTVQQLRARVQRWPTRYRRQLKEIGLLVKEGAQALSHGDLEALGDIMNVDHGILAGMGLSGSKTDDMVHQLRALGALGAKLTGAGGNGGAVIGLFTDASRAAKALTARHVHNFVSHFEREP